MYRLVLTFFLCLMIQTAFAQIPNAGFETWTGGHPDNWFAANLPYTTVTQSSTSHLGSSAVRGVVSPAILEPYTYAPTISAGVDAHGFSISEKPVSLTGYFQFSPAASSGDRFGVDAVLYKGGAEGGIQVAVGAVAISATTSSYTHFSATFNYLTSDIPDTCTIIITIVGPGTGLESLPHAGSSYLLDDLAFSGSTGVQNQNLNIPAEVKLQQNYPNPFNPSTTISYSLSKASFVKLRVFNILGKEVTTLVNGFQSAGNHSAHFLASNIASGVYFYRLEAEGYTAMRHMLLVK
jgi:hypothetical protein